MSRKSISTKSSSIVPGSSLKPYSARQSQAKLLGLGGSGSSNIGKSKNPGRDSTNLSLDSFRSSSVIIPPDLPDILKLYAKAAMRTHPPDLLEWSGTYFRALANGQPLPVKHASDTDMSEQ